MKALNPIRARPQSLLSMAIAASLFTASPQVIAQTSSATLRGQVTAAAAADTRITATNVDTGLSRSAQAAADGSYRLTGLPPGTYRVEAAVDGRNTIDVVTLSVGQTATLDLGTSTAAPTGPGVESVVVVATQLYEAKTSEVATYVSQKQIEALPQNSRNFLAFADIVPGVQFVQSPDGSTSELRSGGQSANGVNVFIDGVGQKNYALRGGVGGQTLSAGIRFRSSASISTRSSRRTTRLSTIS